MYSTIGIILRYSSLCVRGRDAADFSVYYTYTRQFLGRYVRALALDTGSGRLGSPPPQVAVFPLWAPAWPWLWAEQPVSSHAASPFRIFLRLCGSDVYC